MWAPARITVTENCKGQLVFIYSSEKDCLTYYQLCDQFCDGDIYRYTVRNEPLLCGVNVETWLKC